LILRDVRKVEIVFSLADGAEEKALSAGKNDYSSATPDKRVSVGVHLADVSVLGKAFYVTLLRRFVHFLFQRFAQLADVIIVKAKLGVKDQAQLLSFHQ
jgi:hypothetical protein